MKYYALRIVKADNEIEAIEQLRVSNGLMTAGNKIIPFLDEQGAEYTLHGAPAETNSGNKSILIYLSVDEMYMAMFRMKCDTKLIEISDGRLARIKARQ